MRLEDALLFLVIDSSLIPAAKAYNSCMELIEVGADMISVRPSDGDPDQEQLEAVSRACADGDALFMVWDDPERAASLGADGVHLSNSDSSIGTARGIAGMESMVGYSTRNVEEAVLAAEVAADYAVHLEGVDCPSAFAQLRGSGMSYLFAGGLKSVDEARAVIGNGVFRVCLEITNEEEARADVVAEYSRLFGRVV